MRHCSEQWEKAAPPRALEHSGEGGGNLGRSEGDGGTLQGKKADFFCLRHFQSSAALGWQSGRVDPLQPAPIRPVRLAFWGGSRRLDQSRVTEQVRFIPWRITKRIRSGNTGQVRFVAWQINHGTNRVGKISPTPLYLYFFSSPILLYSCEREN